MTEITPESIATPERMPQDVFYDLLNGVGNHEAKLLVAAIVTDHPNSWFTMASIHHELIDRQGQQLAWAQSYNTAFSYLEKSLGPIGAVVKGRIKGERGEVDAYKASEVGRQWGLPLAGELMEWSLTYPDLSLQKILGRTSTGQVKRSPEARFHVLEALLTEPNNSPAQKDIELALGGSYKKTIVDKHLEELKYLGVIDISSVYQKDFNPKVVIDPNPRIKNNYQIPETRLIFSATRKLAEMGVTEASYSELYNLCMQIQPDMDPAKLRARLKHGLNPNTPSFPWLAISDSQETSSHNKSVIKVLPEFRPAIEDLIIRLESLADANGVDESVEKAHAIISDPKLVHSLMSKAEKNSPFYKGQKEGGTQDLDDRITRIVSAAGTISISEVRNLLALEGRPISSTRTSGILNKLTRAGLMGVTIQASSKSTNTKIKVFSPAEPKT